MNLALLRLGGSALALLFLCSCATGLPPGLTSPADTPGRGTSTEYVIGPGDTLRVFVWRNEEFSVTVPVRPDGKFSTPLVEDIQAVGRTPTALGREIEARLSQYIKNPVVTIIVTNFVGSSFQQVRVIGEATRPQAIPHHQGMTLLDVMIAVNGLTEFAAGNRAKIVRGRGTNRQQYNVRLEDLLKKGDISADAEVLPGDILIIPQSFF